MPLVSKTFSEIITFTRASSATYFDSAGLLTSAATNIPRLDYNPATLAAQGLLIEEQRVNLLTYSSDFDNAGWVKTRCTVSANVATAPDGTTSADAIVEDATAANTHDVRRGSITNSATTTWSLSFFCKAVTRTWALVELQNGAATSNRARAWFDLQTGVVGTGNAAGTGFTYVSHSIQNVGNGWYRCILVAIADVVVTTLQPLIQGTTADNITSYNGVDGQTSIYLYGAQLEAGAFATSYAPSVNTFTSRSTTGTFFDSAGVLQSAATNVARNTYNPANLAAQPYLLLEEARTNSIRNNTMQGAVAGTPGTSPNFWSIAFNTTTGLASSVVGTGTDNGITYIDLRINGTASGAGSFDVFFESASSVAALTGQTWTGSLYWKLQAGSTTGLSNPVYYYYEYTSAIVFITAQAASISLPTGSALNTQRVTGTKTLTGGATTAFLRPLVKIDIANGAAIDITLRIGLPQLEQGAFATSVIPTTTTALTRAADISSSSQATRAADVASVNTLSPWFNASEGTLFSEATFTNTVSFNTVAALSDGTTSNSMRTIQWNDGTDRIFTIASSGATQAAYVGTGQVGTAKFAGAYKLNDVNASKNGSIGITDTTAIIPTINTLWLGQSGSAIFSLNGYLRRLSYYPRRLSDAELQSITT